MIDLAPIVTVVARTRRRLQAQRALDWATTAAIPAVAAGLVDLWAYRMRLMGGDAALGVAVALAAGVGVAALLGAARSAWSTALVATRLDRASGLSDRLGTACDFAAKVDPGTRDLHPDTRALMVAAIADGVGAATRADVRAAAPFRAPRDLRALAAFTVVAVAVASMAFGGSPGATPPATRDRVASMADSAASCEVADERDLDDAELALIRLEVDDMRIEAEARGDEEMVALAVQLDKLLAAAGRGELSKADLLGAVDGLLDGRSVRGGRSGRLADVRDAIRRLPPPPPPPRQPPPSPPPEGGTCTGGKAMPTPPRRAPPSASSKGISNESTPLALGPESPRMGKTRDQEVAGKHGNGPSRRETIRAAARQGFAQRGYVKVYADYRAIVEEVLSTERVPQGYRTAVKRYFGIIHPK